MLTLNSVVQTQMMLKAQVTQIQQLSQKTQKLHKLILVDHKLKLREIAEELKISEGSVFTNLHEHLSMRNVCTAFAHSQSKTTCQRLRALFATVLTQQKGVFA